MTDNIEETNVQPPYSRREILLQEINTQLTGGTAGNIEELVPPPYTREEILLIEMLTAIESGGGGGGEEFDVTITLTSATTGTSDKTGAEIMEAHDAGKRIVVLTSIGGADERWLYPTMISEYDNNGVMGIFVQVVFAYTDMGGTLCVLELPFAHGDENSWTLTTYDLSPNVPTVSQDSETGALTIS